MDNEQYWDYVFLVLTMLERYKSEYAETITEATKLYEGHKQIIRDLCRKRGISEEDIEFIFKRY